jgi:hypothetical protein
VYLLVGCFIGYLLCRRQKRETRSKEETIVKKKIIQSFLTELKMNNTSLSEGLNSIMNLNGKKLKWFTHPLYLNTYQNAKTSGRFIQLSPYIQTALSVYYERLEVLKNACSDPTVTLIPKMYEESLDAIKKLIESLKEGYPLIIEELEKEINSL